MSFFIESLPPFSIFPATGGSSGAELSGQGAAEILGSDDNINVISIRATSGTAASTKTLIFTGTSVTNDAAATVVLGRPLGGTGLATLANLEALHVLLTTDPLTAAETLGTAASRTTAGNWKLTDATGTAIWAMGTFSVNAAGQSYSTAHTAQPQIAADAGLKLTIVFTTFALATHLQVLSAAP